MSKYTSEALVLESDHNSITAITQIGNCVAIMRTIITEVL
jgi:hypothetical protein